MRIEVAGWCGEGLRCPDTAVELVRDGRVPQVSLIQMPNGTGKTTTLELLKATLSAEPVKDFETLTIAIYCAISPVVDVTGGLIQTASGRASGFGMPRTKRSGCWVQAA